MNPVYTHEVIRLKIKNSLNNFDKIITSIAFKLKARAHITDGATTMMVDAERIFGIELQPPISNDFIPYSDITEETVLIWIKTHYSYPEIQRIIDEELEKQINPNKFPLTYDSEETLFPWNLNYPLRNI